MKQNKLNIENIEKARKYFQEKKPEIFLIADHPIEKEEEYLQELYVSLLCSIAAFDGEVADSETIFIKRIINGIKLKTEFSQLMKKGLDINNQTVDDFINAFSGKALAFNFIADALLLAASDGVLHDKELELIAEISEILKITQKEIDVISQFIAILTIQDQEKLSKFLEENKIPFECEYFIKSFSLEMIITKDIEYYTGDIKFEENKAFLKPIVRFENAKIMINDYVDLIINGQKLVEFINCEITGGIMINDNVDLIINAQKLVEYFNREITGGKNNAMQISNVTEVKIIKCTFRGFIRRVFSFTNIPKILIKDSHFEYCGYKYSSREILAGGVFLFDNTNSEITNCVFNKCYIENGNGPVYRPSGFIGYFIDSNSEISYNSFINCFLDDRDHSAKKPFEVKGNECKITEVDNVQKYTE